MPRLLLIALVLTACGRPSEEHAASHAEEESHAPEWAYHGESGPARWAELSEDFETCGEGQEQSPIDLLAERTSGAARLSFQYSETPISFTHNGHTVQFKANDGDGIQLDDTFYELLQFHVHTPSEHTVGGDAKPMEIHFVHANEDGDLAVVGVLFSEGEENPHLSPIMPLLDQIEPGDERSTEATLDLAEFIPRGGYYHYQGSLTTPPCSEGVEWLVMESISEASALQLATFRTVLGTSNRPVQSLGSREVRRGNTDS